MIKKFLAVALISTLAVSAQSGEKLTPNATFEKPSKQFDVDGIKKFNKSDTILIPTLYLHTLAEGIHKSGKGGAHAKAKYAISNLSPELGEELATTIYQDLVTKLKESGWKVLTYEDVKDNAGWAKLKEAPLHKKLGVPGFDKNLGFGDQLWMTSFPKNTPKIALAKFGAPGAADVHTIYTKVTKDLEVNMLLPVLRFDGPVGYGSTDSGYKKVFASAGVAPAMDLKYAQSGFYSVKAAWGGVNLKSGDGVRVSTNIGDIEVVEQSKEELTSLFSFETFRTMAKGDYRMTLDEAEYKRAIIQSATDYNSILVEGLKAALPKK